MAVYLGIDVGSVSTNLALLDRGGAVIADFYLRTRGQPIRAVQRGLQEVEAVMPPGAGVAAVGTTGSGRALAAAVVGGDVVKNEITAHAVAALELVPDVATVIEVGGQDSKMIILRDGIVVDFAMNTVCAAGTGSFLDHQAARLGIPIEEFGDYALQSRDPVRIAGRCSVFAESDMVHKQQLGHSMPDIIAGLCQSLVRNYLNNVGKGKDIAAPVLFQGGVAANRGICRAFEEELGLEVLVPGHYGVMGAIGAALLAAEQVGTGRTQFRGFDVSRLDYRASSFECEHCSNRCEIVNISIDDRVVARWGGRCHRWEAAPPEDGVVAG